MSLGNIVVPPATVGNTQGPQPASLGDIGGGPPPAPSAGDWRAALLAAMGAPVTASNLAALGFWHQSEGTNPSTNNWLAITDPGNKFPHSGVIASNGGNPVYAFPDQATGVAATAAFLRGSYYTGVVQAFKANAGLGGIYSAINASKWCSGCQGGHYPVALFQAVGNPAAKDPGPGGSGGLGLGGPTAGILDPVGTENRCFIGPFVMPGSVPNIPCLFYESWGWAFIGGLALVAGAVTMMVGGILLVAQASTVRQAVGMIPTPAARFAAGPPTPAAGITEQERTQARVARQGPPPPTQAEERRGRMARADRDRPLRSTPSASGRTTLVTADEEPF